MELSFLFLSSIILPFSILYSALLLLFKKPSPPTTSRATLSSATSLTSSRTATACSSGRRSWSPPPPPPPSSSRPWSSLPTRLTWSMCSRPTSTTTPRAATSCPSSTTSSVVASSSPTASGGRSSARPPASSSTLGRLVPLLRRASRSGDVVGLQDVFERFAFDSICSLVFDQDPNCLLGGNEEGERFFHAFDEATHLCIDRAKQALPLVWKLKKWLDVGSERRLRESLSTVHESIDMFIYLKRRQCGGDGGEDDDLLSRFVKNGEQSNEFLRDFLISIVLAGRDTTPAAITWFFWELSSRPDVVEAIREELRSIRSRQEEKRPGEVFKLEELRDMHYLQAAISESLRLHPAVPLLPRVCETDDKLPDGTAVCKGWTVMYNSYAMGRDERIWGKDCKEFRPQRWLEEGESRAVSAFRYPVFHAGPRMCLGKDMAVIQMKALTATILEGFEMELVEKRGKHLLSVSMRMEGGLPMRFRERGGGIKAF